MPISFEQIPPNTLLPLFYAEVTSAREPLSSNLRLCLIGQMNKDPTYGEGTAVANTPYILSGTNADALFGRGSMLSWMYQSARRNAPFAEIWGVAIPEDVDAVRGTCTITFIKPGSTSYKGTAALYIAGRKVNWAVNIGDTTAALAVRAANRFNKEDLPVKATVTGSVITLTCRWAGNTAHSIKVVYGGPRGKADYGAADTTLARKMTTTTGSGGLFSGTGENNPAAAFATLLDRPFDLFASGYSSSSFYNAISDFMDQRWSPYQQLYGHYLTVSVGAFQNQIDTFTAFNDPHTSVLGIMQSSMPPWEWSGALAGIMVTHWAAPPELSRPLQTLELHGMYVGDDDDESFSKLERQQLLEQGVSTFHVDPDYTCRIDRIRTLRKNNAYGDPDPSWADAITMFQAQYFVRQIRAAITGTYPRAALTTQPSGINGFTSPQEIRQLVIHEYARMAAMGLVENTNLFAQYLVVERDPVDRNRVNLLMRPDMVNQLRVVAAVVETHLELTGDEAIAA